MQLGEWQSATTLLASLDEFHMTRNSHAEKKLQHVPPDHAQGKAPLVLEEWIKWLMQLDRCEPPTPQTRKRPRARPRPDTCAARKVASAMKLSASLNDFHMTRYSHADKKLQTLPPSHTQGKAPTVLEEWINCLLQLNRCTSKPPPLKPLTLSPPSASSITRFSTPQTLGRVYIDAQLRRLILSSL
jgi:hypothetical protein